MALTAARNTPQLGAGGEVVLSTIDVPQGVNTIYQGGIVVMNAGYGAPATAAAGLICAGKAEFTPAAVSSVNAGSAGSITIRVKQGVFRFANSATTDLIAATDMGKLCYLVDDQTVAKTSSAGSRSVAGVIMFVDSTGVYVYMALQNSLAAVAASGSVGTAWQGAGSVEAIAAAGALSVNTDISTLAVTGTTAYTLANGLWIGQEKEAVVISGASTPVGTITPATPSGFATVTTLTAKGSGARFKWGGAGAWYLAAVFGGATVT